MKKILFLTVLVLCTASLAFGQTVCGTIGWYESEDANDCDLAAPGGAPVTYYLVHSLFVNVEGVTLKVNDPTDECVTWAFPGGISILAPGLQIGDILTEMGFSYQACLSGSVTLASYGGFSPTADACCELGVYPGDFQGFLCRPCDQASIPWNLGVISYMNGNPIDCPCLEPIANEESTWGGIKALYGE